MILSILGEEKIRKLCDIEELKDIVGDIKNYISKSYSEELKKD